MFENVKTVFFDYDGTINESIKLYAPAFRKAYKFLVDKQLAEDREYTEEQIAYWLGFSSKEMWENFMPDLDKETRDMTSKMIGKEMEKQLAEDKAALYDGAIDTLKYLKDKGYKLVFISNCGIYYRDMMKKSFRLDDYFQEMACSEEYEYIPKHEILYKIKEKYPKDMVIVGDRIHDMEAGKKNNIYTIGCNYGYGSKEELKEADVVIENITDIKNIL